MRLVLHVYRHLPQHAPTRSDHTYTRLDRQAIRDGIEIAQVCLRPHRNSILVLNGILSPFDQFWPFFLVIRYVAEGYFDFIGRRPAITTPAAAVNPINETVMVTPRTGQAS
jgi:hypothetical protein